MLICVNVCIYTCIRTLSLMCIYMRRAEVLAAEKPFVTVAFAQTIDGSIAPVAKRRLNISSAGNLILPNSTYPTYPYLP